MKLERFDMERWQSTYENSVEYNLSESGVVPMRIRDLLTDPSAVALFLEHPAAYSQGNGTPELRSLIARLYPRAAADNVLVTNGSSEAILLATWHLIEEGDEAIVVLPNYMESWGLVKMFGGNPKPLWLREELGWQFDPEDLRRLLTPKTRLIAVCNPNNPTGAVMRAEQRASLLAAAGESGAWLVSDEVYIGAESNGSQTESFWGEHPRTIITSGLSKAYALPGLRIGWAVAAPDTISALWSHHDYTTLTPTYLSDRLAQIALRPERRQEILIRTRGILNRNWSIVEPWLAGHGSFHCRAPEAGAICYIRYDEPIGCMALAEALRQNHSTLVVPGCHFRMGHYFRIGFGGNPDHIRSGLERIEVAFATLTKI